MSDFTRFCNKCGFKIDRFLPPTKKLRVSGTDRISNLPDDIISNILSCLPTIDAVQTCVLSQCWKYNWTSIHNISVDFRCLSRRLSCRCESFNKQQVQAPRFDSFVNKVLDLTRNSRLRKFRLDSYYYTDAHQICTWISTVLNRGVQNLIVDVFSALKESVYLEDCTTLEELKLSLWECTLEVPVNTCFSKLKHLHLKSRLEFKILSRQCHDTGQLLLNFPVLQVLKLENFKILNVKSVEIRAPELIIFSTHYSTNYRLDDCVIKIHGPKLQKIYSREGYINIDLYAPVVHYIDLHHECIERDVLAPQVHRILQGVPGLTCLKLNCFVVQALTLRKSDLIRFDQLKLLEVECNRAKPLLKLLHTMANLEYLNIVFTYWHMHDGRKPLPLCIVPHLKEVKFMKFRGEDSQVDLIKLILDNAKKLEKVFVFPANNHVSVSCLTALASKTSACLTIYNRPNKETSFDEDASFRAHIHD